jgi:hypothetical protein
MKDTLIKNTLVTLIFFLVVGALFAQTNFSGGYAIDTAKTDFGQAPQWVLPVSFTINQQGTKVALTRYTSDAHGNTNSYSEQLTPDDTVTTKITGNLSRKTILTWGTDQTSFTLIYFTTDLTDKPLNKATEKWSLQDEGKTLVLDRLVEQANELSYPIKGYYTKAN